MEIYVGKIVGRISGKRWAQVHDFTHEMKGRLVVAASLVVQTEKTEVEMVEMGRELLARVHELYFGNLEEEVMISLKQTVETMETEFEGVEIVVLAMVGEVLYVVANVGGAWAKMKEKEGWIIRPDVEPGVKVLSSWAKNQETLVLGNSRFWEELPLGVVKAAVENNDVEAAVETLGAVVHGGEKGEGAVGVVVRLHDDKSQIPNPPAKRDPALRDKPKINFKLPEIRLPKIKWPSLPNKGPVYVVRGDKETVRKRMMWVGIGFLVTLVLLVGGWRWSERNKQVKQSEQNKQIEIIAEKFNEARAVVTLNPARSRELLKEIDPEVQKLKKSFAQRAKTQSKDGRVRQIVEDWEGVWNEAMGTKTVQPELVVDLGLVREGMVGEKLEIRDEKLVVLDTQGDRLVEVDPEKKSAEVVAGKDNLGEARLLATYPGRTVVFSDKGIVEFPNPRVVVKLDSGWGEIVDMGMWGGNIYLLSKAGIWKHQGGESGYGLKQAWLAKTEDTTALVEAKSMAIDGSVWIMQKLENSKTQIAKYTRGVRESFETTGIDGLVGRAIYTDDETEKLYILDAAGGRVVVLAKTGEYESQYTAEAIKGATGLVVDEKAGKIYLLAGSKVYEINK